MSKTPLVILLACLASAAAAEAEDLVCAGPLKPMLRTELYFGRHTGDRLAVNDKQWARFVATELTPRFPDGLTVLEGKGQWRDGGRLMREPSKIVIVITAADADARERINAATRAYVTRFRQKSVGVVTQPVCAAF